MIIQTWPWRCYMSHSRWCWLLISCWWQLLIPILSVCQGLYHLVNVRARFWGWQALNHFLLTWSGEKSAYVHTVRFSALFLWLIKISCWQTCHDDLTLSPAHNQFCKHNCSPFTSSPLPQCNFLMTVDSWLKPDNPFFCQWDGPRIS